NMAEKGQAAVANETEEKQEETEKVKLSNELKVVIILKDDRIMLGAQSPDCDPVYETLTGTLAAALKRVPKLVAGAKEKWATNPRNPEANLPKPKPSPTPARTPAAPKEKPAQPSFF
ncbi:unnamed protein product, partial [marine sediment metagenome]